MKKVQLTESQYQSLRGEHLGVRADYSGRGMWGEECLAYTGPEPTLFAFDLARTVVRLKNRDSADPDAAGDVRQALIDIGEPKVDTLGSGMVWYWPNVVTEVDMAMIDGGD